MLDVNALRELLEVETNKLNEINAEKKRYEQGVRAMALATNVEGN